MFTIEDITRLMKQMDETNLTEFRYETEGFKIVLKKDLTRAKTQEPVQTEVKEVKQKVVPNEEPSPVEEKQEIKPEPGEGYHYITSPMVGTFYAAPAPDAEPYVKVGSKVKKDTIVCIVEAMKLFNEIEAEVEGEIAEILVTNGQLVEYGQPLFLVKLD